MLKFEDEIVSVLKYLFISAFMWRGFVLFSLLVYMVCGGFVCVF